ncbi:hypothetical protein [Amycolatopsis sp. NPDC003861]
MTGNQTDHETTLAAAFESRDQETPVFNETMDALRDQLPSLLAHGSPAATEEASNQNADDSGDGDQG